MLTPLLTFVVLGALHDGVTVWERAQELPGHLLEVVQALVLEAALLIAVTMFLADLLRAKIDPGAAART